MFRQALLRPAAALRAPLRPAAVARRWQSSTSVNVPNTGSVPPPAEVSHAYAPGEEIDPQLNGYPQLPRVFSEDKPALGWWDVQQRRNFGETVHEEDDVLGMWGPDPQPVDGWTGLFQIGIAVSAICALFAAFAPLKPQQEAVPKSFPYGGLHREYGDTGLRARDEADDPVVEYEAHH